MSTHLVIAVIAAYNKLYISIGAIGCLCFNVNIMELTKGARPYRLLYGYPVLQPSRHTYDYSILLKCKRCASLRPNHMHVAISILNRRTF